MYALIHSLWRFVADIKLLHASKALFRTPQSWHLYASIQPQRQSWPIYRTHRTPAFCSNWFDVEDVNDRECKHSESEHICEHLAPEKSEQSRPTSPILTSAAPSLVWWVCSKAAATSKNATTGNGTHGLKNTLIHSFTRLFISSGYS